MQKTIIEVLKLIELMYLIFIIDGYLLRKSNLKFLSKTIINAISQPKHPTQTI